MNSQPQPLPGPMSAAAYLEWVAQQPRGRFELVNGNVAAMAPERAAHVRTKTRAVVALSNAIAAAGLPCEVYGKGMAVLVSEDTVYEPDAQVRCGPNLPGDAVVVVDPMIVVEVLSPSTRQMDTGKKLTGYASLDSLQHYLVLDPDNGSVLHYRTVSADEVRAGINFGISPAESREADLVLDPPGLHIPWAALFETP